MTIGERIRFNRMAKSLSQKQLAELLNVTPQTISKWENDLSEPGFQLITHMTSIFQISHDELFVGESEEVYKGVIYTALKDSRMGVYYDFFTWLCIGLSVALIVTTSYVSTVETLTWHFPFGQGLLALIFVILLFFISRWREGYRDSPKELMHVYYDKIEIMNPSLTVTADNIKQMYFSRYRFYSGIRVFDNNGYLKIHLTNRQTIIVRDVLDIMDVKKVLLKLQQNMKEETK